MVTRNIVLTNAQDQLVQDLIASGRFQNAGEAPRAGLRLLKRGSRIGVHQARIAEGSVIDADWRLCRG